MHLVIDIGNTLIKSYVFEQDQIVSSVADSIDNWNHSLKQIIHSFPELKSVIVSDVNYTFSDELNLLLSHLNVFHCSADVKLPFETLYAPKTQLGADRIALLAACCLHYPNTEVLVIDIGSCITYDLIDSHKIHQGGSISPGFGMRYKSMNDYSGALPLLSIKGVDDPLGNSTEEAMHAGVYYGILNEIGGIISWYRNTIDNLTVILTGGDAERLSKPLKNSIFAHSNFLAEGLNYILAINTTS